MKRYISLPVIAIDENNPVSQGFYLQPLQPDPEPLKAKKGTGSGNSRRLLVQWERPKAVILIPEDTRHRHKFRNLQISEFQTVYTIFITLRFPTATKAAKSQMLQSPGSGWWKPPIFPTILKDIFVFCLFCSFYWTPKQDPKEIFAQDQPHDPPLNTCL